MEKTIRKCARTCSEVLTLMELYPEYTFIQSSTLHPDWIPRYYSDIFEGIRQKVAEGRYEPNGGVWVECDLQRHRRRIHGSSSSTVSASP